MQQLHLFLSLILAVLMCVLVGADPLYPVCTSKNISKKVVTSKSADTIVDIPTPCNKLEITCLAYNVTTFHVNPDDRNTDYCTDQGQNTYNYDIHMEVYNLTAPSQSSAYNVRDSLGSSVAGMTIFSPSHAGHRIVFTNQVSNPNCMLETYLAVDSKCHDEPQRVYIPPALVGIMPTTLYHSSSTYSYVCLQLPSTRDRNTSLGDTVTVVNYTSPCGDASASQLMTYVADPPDGTISNSSLKDNITVYSFIFNNSGMFRLCYHVKEESTTPSEIAVLTVYGSNPAYYSIYGDNNSVGEIVLQTPTVIKFWGSSLDTRPGGDSAKLVGDGENCDVGAPAGGVPASTYLEPANTYGPNATYALWNLTVRKNGVYKVCYKTRTTGYWAEVPFIKDIGTGSADASDVPDDTVPIPTDPDTGKACAMASANDKSNPWVNYHGIELVLTTGTMPSKFFLALNKFLCVPPAAITFAWLNHTTSKKLAVYFTINCEVQRAGDKLLCSSIERYNYLVNLNSTEMYRLSRLGIQSVRGIKTAMTFDNDTNTEHDNYNLSTALIISILLFSSAVLMYVAASRYMKSRQAYIQFGTDFVDIDDMYSADETLHEGFVSEESGPRKNTLIEIED